MNSDGTISRSPWKPWVVAFGVTSLMINANFLDIVWTFSDEKLNAPALEILAHVSYIIIGAFLGAILADIFGRKITLLGASVFIIVPAIGSLYGLSERMLIVKIFIDHGSGIICTIIPLYISEIAADKNTKRLLTFHLPFQSIGSIVILIGSSKLGEENIRIVNAILAAFSVSLYCITLALFPETPDYLSSKNKYHKAAQSLALFRGINQVQIREAAIEMSNSTGKTNGNQQRCVRKIRKMFKSKNRRSLAIIFSLIAIKWVIGQCLIVYQRLFTLNYDYVMYSVTSALGIDVVKLFSCAIIILAIDTFKRKLSILLVICVSLFSTIIGMAGLCRIFWLLYASLLMQNICHYIIIGVILAYMGELFPINIRAFAFATVVSFEVLTRGTYFAFQYLELKFSDNDNAQVYSFCSGGIHVCALLLVFFLFPKTNKAPSFRNAISIYEEENAFW